MMRRRFIFAVLLRVCYAWTTRTRTIPILSTKAATCLSAVTNTNSDDDPSAWDDVVDVAIVGAGLGGLCAGAILNTVYGRQVAVYEKHYLAGGCAHAFDRRSSPAKGNTTFTFDSGPTILLGCSRSTNPNALQQVLQVIGQPVEWIPYHGWGMVEYPQQSNSQLEWHVPVGKPNNKVNANIKNIKDNDDRDDAFIQGPLRTFGGDLAVQEYQQLRKITAPLCAGVEIPAMAMRSGPSAIFPLALRHFGTLVQIIAQGNATTGTFAPYMDGPVYCVTSPWLRAWLDALAFSLSGLPANRTAAAAMAFTIADMHAADATLDYPVGGMGSIVDALVRGVEQPSRESVSSSNNKRKGPSAVHLRTAVDRLVFSTDGSTVLGVVLANGNRIRAREGVISNIPVWSLRSLVQHDYAAMEQLASGNVVPSISSPPPTSWTLSSNKDGPADIAMERQPPQQNGKDQTEQSLLQACDSAEQTGSFMHLHLALNATGLDMNSLEPHYTVMDKGLLDANPCAEANMIAVSNPCQLDRSLAPPGTIIVHAYGAGNEPYQYWQGMDRLSEEYKLLKKQRAQVLWRAVESIIPDAKDRVIMELTGSPLTHERFLNRPAGSYGSATEDYLPDGSTPIKNLVLAGDGIFPGIGVPAVAINGASAANSLVRYVLLWRLGWPQSRSKISHFVVDVSLLGLGF